MPRLPADNIRVLRLLIALLPAFLVGCGGQKGDAGDLSNNSSEIGDDSGERPRTPRNISEQDIYSGNWQGGGGTGGAGGASGAGAAPPMPDSAPPPRTTGATPAGVPAAAPSAKGVWSLVLATFTDADHLEAAQRMMIEMRDVAPNVRGLRVHPTAKGSMVVYGSYSGREDPAARRDIDALKALRYQGRQVFTRVMLTYLDMQMLQAELDPHDLHAARRAHPKVDPLYTLDIAMWDDFDSGTLTYDEIRRRAEAYTRQLRLQGYEAYFYHDDMNKRSVVTVGLFDRTAINSTSGLYNSNVTALFRKFPQRLVNGEPMFKYEDIYTNKRKNEDVRVKPQTPVLVLVPDM